MLPLRARQPAARAQRRPCFAALCGLHSRKHGRTPLQLTPSTAEGVLYAEKDHNLPKHPEIEVPNLHVIKLMQSFKSKEYVTERFAWRHYYWWVLPSGWGAVKRAAVSQGCRPVDWVQLLTSLSPRPAQVPDEHGHRVPARVPQPARGRGARDAEEERAPDRRAPAVSALSWELRELGRRLAPCQ